jgi:hypothetical protein
MRNNFRCFQCSKYLNFLISEDKFKLYRCSSSTKKFFHPRVFNKGIRAHTRENPIRTTVQVLTLFCLLHYFKEHIEAHTGEKPYSCPRSSGSTIQFTSGEKSFWCSQCRMSFACSQTFIVFTQVKTIALALTAFTNTFLSIRPYCC